MANKTRLREEINEKYKWDLSKIYKNNEEIEYDLGQVEELSLNFKKYQTKLTSSAKKLYDATNDYFNITRIIDKLVVYANMKFHEDMSISKNQILVGRIDKMTDEVSERMAFYSPELLKEEYSKVLKFQTELEELQKYHFIFEDLFREKEHILSLKEEQMLARLGEIFSSSNNIFDMLNDVDIKFDSILDENGQEVELNESNYSKYMKSVNRDVRKQAFKSLYKSFDSFKNTYASVLKANVQADTFISNIRNYKSSLQMALYGDNIDTKLYDELIAKVSSKLNIVHEYIKLKKQILDLNEMHMYDIYAPIVEYKEKKYSYEEAKDLVIKALEPLGLEYITHLKELFESNCIDVFNNKNKRGGAYSWGSYDTNPYVLLNFEGTFYDVSTIAHELGHAMHSYYSHTFRQYHDSSYTIFLAEIASTVNEILLNQYCYKNANDKKEKCFYLNNLLENFRTTLIRQTMFAEFEKIIHDKDQKKEVLTEEEIASIYYELNKKYYGNNIVHDEEIRLEWARISHFYNSFYVYKYATGISIASSIAFDILENKPNALENYIEFLKSGGKNYSLEILKSVDIDIINDDTIDKALDSFEKTLEEFKENL